ncbi:helix-turn-helix transcriptional regulator [Cohnella fermenti]|uniref:Helix-turn-helix domain-containing protein n=1 Tax=Cohnella fermenti TaxID=2565925 RepID=A0A4S4BYQ8_9BACL|nr:AraC family transcriptional regulator [Cohnella fermenti]THF79872.1 helix-turn-helix domain-containing protein [Cohnella fermenti]
MELLQFTIPPLPHYIGSGYTVGEIGDRHVSRKNIGVFDLLFVTEGCLFVGEEEREYEVSAGHALILRPDCSHYGSKGCEVRTNYVWLHFQTTGSWRPLDSSESPESGDPASYWDNFDAYETQTFPLVLPQFAKVSHAGKAQDVIDRLIGLEPLAHRSATRFEQHAAFQQLIGYLAESVEPHRPSQGRRCAEQAAAYLRENYRREITAKEIGESLSFHPVYIARCMQQEYNCSPMEYLLRYRIEQSKRLLLQTDLTVSRIAEETGFNQAAYFSSCFTKIVGMSPRTYRKQYF